MYKLWVTLPATAMTLVALAIPAEGQQVAEVQVAPVTVTLAVGERRELLATAYDTRGDNVATASFVWTSTAPGVVRVEQEPGLPGIAILVGVSPGIASVEARTGNRRAAAAVQVVPAGAAPGGAPAAVTGSGTATVLQIEPGSVFLLPSEDVRLQPTFMKDDGSPATPTAVQWRSLRADVATVTPEGVVVGVSPGQGVIEAVSSSGLLARVTVQVAQVEFGFGTELMAVSPNVSDTIPVVVPQQNNRALSPRRLVWRSTNDGVARVSPVGVVTGVTAGEAEIIATGFGQESRLRVTVHRAVEFLEVSPRASEGPVAVPLGGTRAFSATALAADETPVPEAPLTWVMADTAVAAFDPSTKTLTGKALGESRLTVRAPGEGLETTWDVNVVAGGLELDPAMIAMGRNESHVIRAMFTDDEGRPVSEAAGVTWTSSAPEIAEIDESGTVRSRDFGSARLVASMPWGTADTARVFVQGEIAVASTREGSPHLYYLDREQPGDLRRVTDDPASEYDAAFSPDGTRIAFVSNRMGNIDLYLSDAAGGNVVALTSGPAREGAPAWTPDGRQIVYESDAGRALQLWIMNADGTNQRQLTSGDGPNIRPAVSPDGQTIAFTSARDKNFEIYLVNLDGTNPRNFTSSPDNETMPAWVGDSAIAFVREERQRRSMVQRVISLNFQRVVTVLSPEGLAVTDFAIAPGGDLLAAIVAAEGPDGLENRLYLIPLSGGGTPAVVPRQGPNDQFSDPSFRR